jgi:hypothetical protein
VSSGRASKGRADTSSSNDVKSSGEPVFPTPPGNSESHQRARCREPDRWEEVVIYVRTSTKCSGLRSCRALYTRNEDDFKGLGNRVEVVAV